MIWKTKHLNADMLQLREDFNRFYNSQKSQQEPAQLAVIGGGPKGFYALDNLSKFMETQPKDQLVVVDWYNSDMRFGFGPNFDIALDDYLLINYCIGNINCWHKTCSDKTGNNRFNLKIWLEYHTSETNDIEPTDYASRAVVGYYLLDALMELLQNLPSNLKVNLIVDQVTDLKPTEDNNYEIYLKQGNRTQKYASVNLCTGNSCGNYLPEVQEISHNNPDFLYLSSAYPPEKLKNLNKSFDLAVMGMGLTFIDASLTLTEGRGGKFVEDDGVFKYIADQVPITIYPFSRNNLPMLPRSPIYGPKRYILKYITPEWIKKMSAQKPLDFNASVLPVLDKEIRFAYYSTLLKTRDEHEVEKYMIGMGNLVFTIERLLFPTQTNTFKSHEGYNEYILDYLEILIEEAEKGELESPIMAAAAVWREATDFIAQLYAHNGFTGASQREFDQRWYPSLSRVSYGPPLENMKKMVALLRQKVIRFAFANTTKMAVHEGAVYLKSKSGSKRFTKFLDARIGRLKWPQYTDTFYGNLIENRIAVPLENEGYVFGGVTIDTRGRLLGAVKVHEGIFLYGTPNEGNLLDNDTLSRTKHDTTPYWIEYIANNIIN